MTTSRLMLSGFFGCMAMALATQNSRLQGSLVTLAIGCLAGWLIAGLFSDEQ